MGVDFWICDPGKIRTCNRLIRSQVLYPVELRDLNELQKYFI